MATRYVAQLEAHLGVRAAQRTTRKLSLTEAAATINQRATQILAMVEEAEPQRRSRRRSARGTLRVNTSVAFGAHHMGRGDTEYLQRYPGVRSTSRLNDRVVDLVEEGFDLAIRHCRARRSGAGRAPAHARAHCGLRLTAYLKQRGTPRSPEQLSGHNCLTYAYAELGRTTGASGAKGWSGRSQRCRNLQGNNGDIL